MYLKLNKKIRGKPCLLRKTMTWGALLTSYSQLYSDRSCLKKYLSVILVSNLKLASKLKSINQEQHSPKGNTLSRDNHLRNWTSVNKRNKKVHQLISRNEETFCCLKAWEDLSSWLSCERLAVSLMWCFVFSSTSWVNLRKRGTRDHDEVTKR